MSGTVSLKARVASVRMANYFVDSMKGANPRSRLTQATVRTGAKQK